MSDNVIPFPVVEKEYDLTKQPEYIALVYALEVFSDIHGTDFTAALLIGALVELGYLTEKNA